MTKAKAIEVANEYFPTYPGVHEFHITSDEQVFEEINNARNHAKTLDKDSQDVISVTRDDKADAKAAGSKKEVEQTDDQKLEAAKQKVTDATADLQVKQQALNDAPANKKGTATIALNKATSALQVAKDELELLMK